MKNLNSTYKVIANAVENDTASLKQLLIRNGVAAMTSTKDELQRIVTGALATSDTFRKEFLNWVLIRSGAAGHANVVGEEDESIFGDLFFGIPQVSTNPNATTTTTTTTTTPESSFWSDVSFNSILDFAKTGLNNYTEIVKSKNDKAIVDAAVEKERLNQNTMPTMAQTGGVPTWVYVTGVLAIIGGIGIYVYNKNK